MPRSSPKNLCLSGLLSFFSSVLASGLLTFFTPTPALGAIAKQSTYKFTLESRLAAHVTTPRDLASHRHTLEAEQKLDFYSPWSFVGGFRAYAEAAFSVNPRYGGEPVQRLTSQELLLRDFYLEYKKKKFLFRAGNQQVVWGEAFGFYFADIVNPKDLRELGLNDLTQQRLMTPLLNAVLFFPKGSAQLIYIPKPYFHKIAELGSDFAPPLKDFFPGRQVTLTDVRTRPLTLLEGEFGFRLSRLTLGWDLGLFFLTYYDRTPVYQNTFPDGNSVDITTAHNRVGTLGLTGTKDFRSGLLRFETLYTRQRSFNAYTPPDFSTFSSDEWIAAAEWETPMFLPWRLGFQAAHTWTPSTVPGALVDTHRTLLSSNLRGPLWGDTTLESILSLSVQDGSSLARIRYTIPTSTQLELVLGGDLLFGGRGSQFGRYHGASRAYVLLRGYLAK